MNPPDASSKVLFIGEAKNAAYLEALAAAGFQCEHTQSPDAGMRLLRDRPSDFDLVIWDTESQVWALDEAFDKGRYRADVPTLLLLERLYPWIASHGRRPGSLDYLIKPVSSIDLTAAADQNVRVVKAKRYVELARLQVLEMAEMLTRTRDLLGPTGFGGEAGDKEPETQLSGREEEIARMLAKGHRVSHIADMLGISPHTVRNHFKSVFRKLNVHSQVELLARLREIYKDV